MNSSCPARTTAATLPGMVVRKPSFVRVDITNMRRDDAPLGDPQAVVHLVSPGSRYAVRREGEAWEGEWFPVGTPLPVGWSDVFTEAEARLLLPSLRLRANAGRAAREPTTADGRLIARAKRALGVTAAQLAKTIGTHESVLSRAMHGALPDAHRAALRALLTSHDHARPRTK